ncbi:MAG TPA: A/G-specific adenine glycosylase [Spirochaetia bacterium]|nr:A/G-specific adenine glycosylase [Spirochaetia bacterium]
MLQQTSVPRVMAKYGTFIRAFPSLRSLALASVQDVLAAWKGLGYNRRALALHSAAKIIVRDRGGRIPRTLEELSRLPGLGVATASSVLVFSHDVPLPFIETNVRRVFIHFFFPGRDSVSDAEIVPLVEKTLDRSRPREWYYALMDYGAMLGRTDKNANRRSRTYVRQSRFEGSLRQLRGRVLDVMLRLGSADAAGIQSELPEPDQRLATALDQLVSEGFLRRRGNRYYFR